MLFIKLYIYQKILKNKEYHRFHTKYEAAKLLLKTVVMKKILLCITGITFYNILKSIFHNIAVFFYFILIK